MKDRELTKEEFEHVKPISNAYATCCSQRDLEDHTELMAAHLAGFTYGMSYRDAQDRMDRAAATKTLAERRWQVADIDGIMHFKGLCCHRGTVPPCRACGGPRHVQGVYGGLAEVCERCDASAFREVSAKDLLATMSKERLIEVMLELAPIAVAATARPVWDAGRGRFVDSDESVLKLFENGVWFVG